MATLAMGEEKSSNPEKQVTASQKEVHRLALQASQDPEQPRQQQQQQDEQQFDEEDHGFDLSILLKPQKHLEESNKNSSSSNLLGASYASELSVLTEDGPYDPEESRSWNDSSWFGDSDGIAEDEEEPSPYGDETMELVERALSELKEMSLEEKSDSSAIEDAIQSIQSALKEDGDAETVNNISRDLDTIRRHLASEEDVREAKDDSKSMMWETILCRLRGGTALSLYSLLAAKFQDTAEFLSFGVKFAGVAVLCFLAGVPRRDEKEATPKGFRIQVLFCSRKTVLLLIYIVAWISVFDASMEAWEEHRLRLLNRNETTVGDGPSVLAGLRLEQENSSTADLDKKPLGFLKKKKKKLEEKEVELKPQDSTERENILDILKLKKTKSDEVVVEKPAVDKPKEKAPEQKPKIKNAPRVETDKEPKKKTLESPSFTPKPSQVNSRPAVVYIKQKVPTFAPEPSKALRGESAPDGVLRKSKNKLLDRLKNLIMAALRHGVLFLVGSEDGHKSQDMLDLLHEVWFQRRWH